VEETLPPIKNKEKKQISDKDVKSDSKGKKQLSEKTNKEKEKNKKQSDDDDSGEDSDATIDIPLSPIRKQNKSYDSK
jgi:hypothetical protein